MCRVVPSYTLDDTLFNGLSDQQLVGDDGYRYLLRATMSCFQGISMGIEGNHKTRVAATIACCASDRIVQVSIDSYLGQENS